MDLLNIATLQRLVNRSKPFEKAMEAYLKFYNDVRKKTPNKNATVVTIHSEIDDLVKDFFDNPMQDKPTCKKGCSFCCHLFVLVSKNEAALLAHTAKDLGIKIDMDLLKKQANFDKPQRWRLLSYKQRACVFLKNGECSVYHNRPASCRTYHVSTPASQCDTETNPNQGVSLIFDIHSEALGETLREKEGFGSMPEMLLKELNNKNGN